MYGIGRSASALGMSSQFLHRGVGRAASTEALIEQLATLGELLGGACLFAIPENDIELLNRHRDRLGAYRQAGTRARPCHSSASGGIEYKR